MSIEIGQQLFGFTVLSFKISDARSVMAKVKHSCGFERYYLTSALEKGNVQVCSKCRPRSIDKFPVGHVRGEWTVLEHGVWPRKNLPYILAKHPCGQTRKFTANHYETQKQECKKCVARVKYRKDVKFLAITKKFFSYKRSASKRGYSFDLSKEDIGTFIFSECTYCGREPFAPFIPDEGKADWHDDIFTTGVDRVDSSKGYSLENCVSCCWTCNKAKASLTLDEWKEMVELWSKKLEQV